MSQFFPLKICDVRRETKDSVSIAFDIPQEAAARFCFTPGQYLSLRTTIEGEEARRSYSICSGLNDGEVRIAIKRVDGGLFSSFANENLMIGAQLDVMPPQGRFTVTLEPEKAKNYLMIAAGSGITPILSIIKSVLASEPKSTVTLVYGNRNSQNIMFSEVLEDLKNIYIQRLTILHVLSREPQDVPVLHGRINADKLQALLQWGKGAKAADFDEAFICGPEEMTQDVSSFLKSSGMNERAVHTELFTTKDQQTRTNRPIPKMAENAKPVAQVQAILDGKAQVFGFMPDDENVIDAAARDGIELPYSCKGGMCCTCRAKVAEGQAEMLVNYSLEPWEVEAGYVLCCQVRPKSASLVLDFDAV